MVCRILVFICHLVYIMCYLPCSIYYLVYVLDATFHVPFMWLCLCGAKTPYMKPSGPLTRTLHSPCINPLPRLLRPYGFRWCFGPLLTSLYHVLHAIYRIPYTIHHMLCTILGSLHVSGLLEPDFRAPAVEL